MSKKHWIYIKRGLSEDPKHRARMGECIWLYMHIIDRADWETGIAFDWKDDEEARDMGMPVDTLRRQREKLTTLDYVRCTKKQHSQDLYIMEWRNPREYDSQVRNPRVVTGEDSAQSLNQSLNQSSNQSSNQPNAQVRTPTLYSKDSKTNAPAAHVPDILDGILKYEKSPQTLISAIAQYFPFNVNWRTKTSKQWLEWAHQEGVTAEQLKKAAEVWRSDKRFNWGQPNLQRLFENWPALMGKDMNTVDESVHVQWQQEVDYE